VLDHWPVEVPPDTDPFNINMLSVKHTVVSASAFTKIPVKKERIISSDTALHAPFPVDVKVSVTLPDALSAELTV
jgi:hypothetical protein